MFTMGEIDKAIQCLESLLVSLSEENLKKRFMEDIEKNPQKYLSSIQQEGYDKVINDNYQETLSYVIPKREEISRQIISLRELKEKYILPN
jgi:hypothetical protein